MTMSQLVLAVDDVVQAYRRLPALIRAGIHDQCPDLAEALHHLDSMTRVELALD